MEVDAAEKNIAMYLHVCTNEVEAIDFFLFKKVHILIDWMHVSLYIPSFFKFLNHLNCARDHTFTALV